MTEAPNPFTRALPTQLRAWDSTSLRLYQECPRKYFLSIVQGWRKPGGVHVEWGRVYHASVEEFDKARSRGETKEAATDVALAYALENTGRRETDAWTAWDTGDNKKSRFTLLRAVAWYCDEQLEDGGVQPYTFPDGRPAVELSFQIPLPLQTPDGEPYLLCGHLDGMATTGPDEVFIRERKTTGKTISPYYFDQFSPDIQVDTYDLAGSVMFPDLAIREVMLEATQTGVNFARFHREMLHSTEGRREEHLQHVIEWIQRAEWDAHMHKMEMPGAYPMNKAACYANGGCPFRDICNKDPAVRERFLAANFVKEFWNPLEER